MKAIRFPSPFRIAAGVPLAILTLWAAGFFIFFIHVVSDQPVKPDEKTDVVIVLTGGPGRIEQGFTLMSEHKAKAMLVTGVHPNVTLPNLVERWNGSAAQKAAILNHCCIFIEHVAESTEDNAAEALGWLNRNGGAKGVSARIVTSDYHMPRAMLLFKRAMPDATLDAWPVKSNSTTSFAFWRTVFLEYSKTILTWLS